MKKDIKHNQSLPDAETLFKWIREGELHEFARAMKSGANPNTSNNKFTLLHAAVMYDRPAFVELLLAKGANRNAQDDKGNTAEYYAISYNFKRIMDIFEKQRKAMLEKQAQEILKGKIWKKAFWQPLGNGNSVHGAPKLRR